MVQRTIDNYYPHLRDGEADGESLYLFRLQSLWGQELPGEGEFAADEQPVEEIVSLEFNHLPRYRGEFFS